MTVLATGDGLSNHLKVDLFGFRRVELLQNNRQSRKHGQLVLGELCRYVRVIDCSLPESVTGKPSRIVFVHFDFHLLTLYLASCTTTPMASWVRGFAK